jgi:hypothetical protein
MTTATAWVQHERDGKQVLIQEKVQLPPREAHQTLVSVLYVAQNPTDSAFSPTNPPSTYITNLHIQSKHSTAMHLAQAQFSAAISSASSLKPVKTQRISATEM